MSRKKDSFNKKIIEKVIKFTKIKDDNKSSSSTTKGDSNKT